MESARRASQAVVEGRRRADMVNERLGTALRQEREAAGLSQAEVARRSLLSQARISQLERAVPPGASIETWAVVAAVLGRRLAAFWESSPGASVPRDIEHLRRQDLLIRTASAGGWRAVPEELLELERNRHGFADVALVREGRHEASVHEIWDLLTDVGEAMRSFDAKLQAMRRRYPASEPRWRVSGLWVVRDTQRNRRLLRELSALFGAKFPGSAEAWLAALQHDRPMPHEPALIWTDRACRRLIPSRPRGWQANPPGT